MGELEVPAAVDVFNEVRRQAHSQSFGYRLMYGLRNHAQHYGQPLHGTTFDSGWTDSPEEVSRRLIFSVTAFINVAELRNSPKITPKLREELAGDLTQVDAPAMVRSYLEGLGSVHKAVRDQLGESLTSWEASITLAIARYAELNKGDAFALLLVELAEDGSTVSTMPLFADMPQRLRRLMRRNGSLINLQRRVVTNGTARPNR